MVVTAVTVTESARLDLAMKAITFEASPLEQEPMRITPAAISGGNRKIFVRQTNQRHDREVTDDSHEYAAWRFCDAGKILHAHLRPHAEHHQLNGDEHHPPVIALSIRSGKRRRLWKCHGPHHNGNQAVN